MAGGGNHFSKTKKKKDIISEINITPFVDILLVLLIIFMISSQISSNSAFDINLPEGNDNGSIKAENEVVIKIDSNQNIIYKENKINKKDLFSLLNKVNHNKTVIIEADKLLKYGHVMKFIHEINLLGFKNVSLATSLSSSND